MAEAGLTEVLRDDFSAGYKYDHWGQPFDGGTYWNGAWSWSKDDVAVRDGVMDLTMTRHDDGWWTGGGFSSFKAGKTITYGKIEFDGQVDEARGTAGVFLTWPASDKWPEDGEIDILESPASDVMHSVHYAGPNGEHWYESVRNQSYDASKWNHYEVTWLPDRLTIEVNDVVVAEWTDPAMIPDVAHGFGSMGMVAAEGEGWLGGAPDGSTPSKVHVRMDNVVMSQWDGVTPLPIGGAPAPTDPAPAPTDPVPPPAAGAKTVQATEGEDTFVFKAGDGAHKVVGFEVGADRIDVAAHVIGEWTYEPWARETAEGTVVQWSWDAKETVLLEGVKGVSLDALTGGGSAPPVEEPPVEVPPDLPPELPPEEPPVDSPPPPPGEEEPVEGPTDPVDPVDPEEPPVETPPELPPELPGPVERGSLTGGDRKDVLTLDHVFHFDVDGGGGKDVIALGDDHEDVTVVMKAGEAKGDVVVGFDADLGDNLLFLGFGEGAELQAMGNGAFRVTDDTGANERFVLTGVEALTPLDYAFA